MLGNIPVLLICYKAVKSNVQLLNCNLEEENKLDGQSEEPSATIHASNVGYYNILNH